MVAGQPGHDPASVGDDAGIGIVPACLPFSLRHGTGKCMMSDEYSIKGTPVPYGIWTNERRKNELFYLFLASFVV